MKDYLSRACCVIFMVLFTMALIYVAYRTGLKHQTNKIIILLPNQGQLQQILNAIEPNNPLKVDYVIGSDSRDKWDGICGNKYASVFHTPSGRPKE